LSDLVRLSMSIEKSLYDRLERLVARSGYSNRSEYLRDLIRERLVEEEWAQDEEVVGAVMLLYDHEVRELSAKLTHEQHHHHDAVLATMHVHLDAHVCVESILVQGTASDIRALFDRLRQQKGVLHAALSLSSTGKDLA